MRLIKIDDTMELVTNIMQIVLRMTIIEKHIAPFLWS
jgi:hypothetical protein